VNIFQSALCASSCFLFAHFLHCRFQVVRSLLDGYDLVLELRQLEGKWVRRLTIGGHEEADAARLLSCEGTGRGACYRARRDFDFSFTPPGKLPTTTPPARLTSRLSRLARPRAWAQPHLQAAVFLHLRCQHQEPRVLLTPCSPILAGKKQSEQ
jgi:hypothetical protein